MISTPPGGLHEEQERYYAQHFTSVNYAGATGLATRLAHRHLERGVGADQHYGTVLELGAAHGGHLPFVRHGFDRYILTDLVDRDLDLIELARSLPPGSGLRRLEFQVQDASSLDLEDRSVDRVLHTCLLHHVDSVPDVLAEIRRVLRPGGIYTAYLPCDPGLVYRAAQRLTAGRAIRRALRDGGYSMTPALLRALEHPNHYAAIRAFFHGGFPSNRLVERHFPVPIPIWNLNFFSVLTIVRR